MSLHQHLEYESELDDPENAEEIFNSFLTETNASKNAVHYDYLLTEEDENFYVNEIGTINGRVNGRRALVTVEEDYIIEGVLEEEIAEKMKRRYEEIEKSYSNSSL